MSLTQTVAKPSEGVPPWDEMTSARLSSRMRGLHVSGGND